MGLESPIENNKTIFSTVRVHRSIRTTLFTILSGSLIAAIVVIGFIIEDWHSFGEKLGFFIVGTIGAIFANTTGAGGGVVFVPLFDRLGLNDEQIISTSFGIQCFGMTAGALGWSLHYRTLRQTGRSTIGGTKIAGQKTASPKTESQSVWNGFLPIVLFGSCLSIMGLWAVQTLNISAPAELSAMFKPFSLALGIAILISLPLVHQGAQRQKIGVLDLGILGVLTMAGGMITAWLSVGVGEIVAFYLILRRYDVYMAIATAVVISAATVWSAAPFHLTGSQALWSIIFYSGPGALVGGLAAKFIARKLPPRGLKLFFAIWLVVIGVAG